MQEFTIPNGRMAVYLNLKKTKTKDKGPIRVNLSKEDIQNIMKKNPFPIKIEIKIRRIAALISKTARSTFRLILSQIWI